MGAAECLVVREQAGSGRACGGCAEGRQVSADELAQITAEVSCRLDAQRAEARERGFLDQLDPGGPATVDGGGVHAGVLCDGLDRRRIEAAQDQQLAGCREGALAEARVPR